MLLIVIEIWNYELNTDFTILVLSQRNLMGSYYDIWRKITIIIIRYVS